ncbi:DUF6414 family protein [Eubacteriaceae bacterium ES2]|nr:DUF6414 family protein [Eubacteriaceae bacterium ES2]
MKKVVYFDEGSVTDYMQIVNKGDLSQTIELLSGTQKNATVDGELGVKLNPFASIFTAIAGISANVGGKVSLSSSKNAEKLATTILQNTVLSDFLEVCKEDDDIVKFDRYQLKEPTGSLSEMLKFSVYTHMMNGSTRINSSDNIELNIDKFDETIKLAKGYFEFLGIDGDEKIVFRFNLDTLRNNYRSTDLTTMDLTIYAIQVGHITDKELDFKNYNSCTVEAQRFCDRKYDEMVVDFPVYKLYDVLLAGVE